MEGSAMSDKQVDLARADVSAPAPMATGAEPERTGAPVPAAGLLVGDANDAAEHRADELADRALRRLGGGVIRRSSDTDAPEAAAPSSPAAAPLIGEAGGELDAGTSGAISRSRGRALDAPVRSAMESAFGTSFASVRIHDGPEAAALSSSISAHAFTTGKDIFFGSGQYNPATAQGQHVLAHELAHVVAEGNSTVRRSPWSKFKSLFKAKDKDPDSTSAKVDESKKLRSQEKVDKQVERAQGIAGRQDLSDKIENGGHPFTGKTPAERYKELSELLAAAIDLETQEAEDLVSQHCPGGKWADGWDEDRVADAAYNAVYIKGSSADILRPIAPMRANAAERLVRTVRRMRTEANVRQSMDGLAKRGAASGSETIDALYDQVAIKLNAKIAEAIGGIDLTGLSESESRAAQNKARRDALDAHTKPLTHAARASAAPELKLKLPTRDSDKEIYYVNAAMQRFSIRGGQGTPSKDPKTFGDFIESWESYGGLGDKGGSVVTLGAKGVGKFISEDKQQGTGLKVDANDSSVSNIPLVGEFSVAVAAADERVKKEKTLPKGSTLSYKNDNDLYEEPELMKDRVTSGIGTGITILSKLKDSVTNGMKTVKAIKDGIKHKDPRKALEAIKAGSDGLSSLTEGAKSTAELAQKIDPGVKDAVGKVIPGFDIAIAALAIVSNAMELANASLYMNDTNTAIQSARVRGIENKGGKQVDVMVYPLVKVAQSHTIQVEQKAWATGKSVSDLVTSISSLATAGGFGIPKAIEAGVSLVDTLHNFAHFVAKELRTATAQLAEKESIRSLEGSAEKVLEAHPAMAVEGIIMRAAKHDDPIAITFLSNFRVDGEVATTLLPKVKAADPDKPGQDSDASALYKVRDAVLASMGDDADPKHIWQEAKAKYDKWKELGQLRKERNEIDKATPGGKGSRGIFWQVKMMLRSDEKTNRSKLKTQIDYGEFTQKQAKAASGPKITGPIKMVCGDNYLEVGASQDEEDAFIEGLAAVDIAELEKAAEDPMNNEHARDVIRTIIRQKKSEKESVTA